MSRLTLLPGETDPNANATATLDDRQAAALPTDTGPARIPVTVELTEFHHAYLLQRAAQAGETPERHLETILRTFRAHHDDRRPDHARPAPAPGMAATTRRAG